jgi:predicted bacteriocin transport accessory protein
LLFLSFISYSSHCSAVSSAVGLVTITQEETKKLIKEDDVAIYVGRDTCPDCQRIMPKLKKQLKNNKKTLYYFDTTAKGEKLFHYRKFYNSLGVKAVPIKFSS